MKLKEKIAMLRLRNEIMVAMVEENLSSIRTIPNGGRKPLTANVSIPE